MTPTNANNGNALIYRILDALGVNHQVAPVAHTHEQSEVSGLASALAGKQATLTFDDAPTSGSNNPVKSGGIFTAIANAVANKLTKLTTFTTGNFVKVKSDGTLEDSGKKASDFADAAATATALAGKQNTLTFDSTPTANSTNPVTSGGIKTALDAKQNTLTFDNTPTTGSNNPVKSWGIKSALDSLQLAVDNNVKYLVGYIKNVLAFTLRGMSPTIMDEGYDWFTYDTQSWGGIYIATKGEGDTYIRCAGKSGDDMDSIVDDDSYSRTAHFQVLNSNSSRYYLVTGTLAGDVITPDMECEIDIPLIEQFYGRWFIVTLGIWCTDDGHVKGEEKHVVNIRVERDLVSQ